MTVAIVLLVMMSAYFSATETAFSCLNKIRMKSRAESGDHRGHHDEELAAGGVRMHGPGHGQHAGGVFPF